MTDDPFVVLQGGYKIPQELAALPTFFGSNSGGFVVLRVWFEGAGVSYIAMSDAGNLDLGDFLKRLG